MGAFIFLNGGIALAALAVATQLRLGASGALALGILGGFLVLAHSDVLVAGLLGQLAPGGLAVLVGIELVAAAVLARGIRGPSPAPTGRGPAGAAWLVAPAIALAAAAAWAWPHLHGATRLWVWDDYTYHMVYPALWLRDHAVAAVTPAESFTMQAWYPLSASVIATWFMVPFAHARGEALAWVSLTGPLYAGLIVAGVVTAGRRLGCRPGAWAVPLALFASSHRTAVMASSFSDADLAQAACLFAALAFAIPRGERERSRDVAVDAGYAAALSGLALGVKVSAAVPALIAFAVLALRARTPGALEGRRARAIGAVALIFAAGWTATGGYWYLRNAIHTGNPVYPAAFLGWPGATFPETTLVEYARHYGVRRAAADALAVYLDWPLAHGGLAALGLAALALRLAVRRGALSRPQRYFAWTSLTVVAAVLVLLPAAPFSAGNAMTFRSGFVHWDSMRYVAVVLLLGWMALGAVLDAGAGAGRRRTWAAALIAAVGVATAGLATAVFPLAGALFLAAVAASRIPAMPPAARRLGHWGVGAALAAAAGLIIWFHGAKTAASGAALHGEGLFGAASAVLDGQPPGTRIAVFGDQWIYPAFGDRLHLRPVRLDRDGDVARLPIGDAMEPGDRTVDPAAFRSKLEAAAVDVVVVVRQPHPGRPAGLPSQHAALEAAGGAQLIYRDQAVAIWRLAPPGVAGAPRPSSGVAPRAQGR